MLEQELKTQIIDKIDSNKGEDIIAIDVRGKSSITDYMIICTGNSTRHVASIASNLIDDMKALDVSALGMEGLNDAEWVVVDFGDVIVHVMQSDARELYQLEKLWG